MSNNHSYGPTCRLAPPESIPPDSDRDGLLDGIPPINAQFFYHSPIPIDDPLSTATIATPGDHKASKGPLRPFSQGDNNALEKAWLTLANNDDRRNHDHARRNRSPSPSLASRNIQKLDDIVDDLILKHREKHAREGQQQEPLQTPPESLTSTQVPVCCDELLIDASNQLRETFCAVARKRQHTLDQAVVVQRVMAQLRAERSSAEPAAPRLNLGSSTASPKAENFVLSGLSTSARGRASSLISNSEREAKRLSLGSPPKAETSFLSSTVTPTPGTSASTAVRPPVVDDGISGQPFVRVVDDETEKETDTSAPREPPARDEADKDISDHADYKKEGVPQRKRRKRHGKDLVEVPVGISRLHIVALPVLQMRPIYWSPVNDIAIVSRATWFYRDTMIGVEAPVANQLEAGYRELRPWTQTYRDELRCAVEVGAVGEEKVAWPLYPEPVVGQKSKDQEEPDPTISSDPFCAARCFRGEAAAEGTLRPVHPEEDVKNSSSTAPSRTHAAYNVVYKDKEAFLLKPSLRPSAYYGRRPISKITKGATVGIPVVRGFDRDIWDKVHERKKSVPKPKDASRGASPPREHCPGCKAEQERGQGTRDLVLVVHGIGQKFAERSESFHFTHAVTAFRRFMNIELENDAVKSVLRKGHSGIMVLPINWRQILSLEDGGPLKSGEEDAYAPDGFSLKDIEPSSIPAVRSIISDVMFDIPFYMHKAHKGKMIQAVVGEANRVYRLWCSNNPGFRENGRVHLICHSLGSVMAVEVLSNQPTSVPRMKLSAPQPETGFFEFDTTNLFLLGSPASFFLLLERGSLLPRRKRQKPGADHSDMAANDVVGEVGDFGCVAVDNIYNILAREDPIAYLLNGTIDPTYASSLRRALVPSATTSWLKSVGDAMRGVVPGVPAPSDVPVKPPTVRLPSQLELEVHDFSREETAERKAFLLNDNGQIDYYLRSNGGPLEIQYLNMLSAHTSYWTNQDLIRMLCVEIGREPGREHTMPAMRAVKAARRIIPATR